MAKRNNDPGDLSLGSDEKRMMRREVSVEQETGCVPQINVALRSFLHTVPQLIAQLLTVSQYVRYAVGDDLSLRSLSQKEDWDERGIDRKSNSIERRNQFDM